MTPVMESQRGWILVTPVMESQGVWRTLVTLVSINGRGESGDTCDNVTKQEIWVTCMMETQKVGFG